MRSIFPYVGGKHRVADRLIKLFPEHRCYVEVFAGAANVLFAKDPSKVEVLNDVNGDLVNIFRVIRWHPDELIKELAFITHSRQEFMDYHDQPGLTDVQRAARYWFKLKTTFSGTAPAGCRNLQCGPGGSANLKHWAYQVIFEAHERLNGVYIENRDYEKLIRKYDRKYTLFFCDPPYWQGANYGVPFEWSDHERLAATLSSLKGKFLLTINDHPDIRALYQEHHWIRVSMTYCVSPPSRSKKTKFYELLIANYPLPKRW